LRIQIAKLWDKCFRVNIRTERETESNIPIWEMTESYFIKTDEKLKIIESRPDISPERQRQVESQLT
jgi:hypothetical protein